MKEPYLSLWLRWEKCKETTYFGKFWAAENPIFHEGPTQGDHQGLKDGEEVYLPKNTIARLVHEIGQAEVFEAQTALNPLFVVLWLVDDSG